MATITIFFFLSLFFIPFSSSSSSDRPQNFIIHVSRSHKPSLFSSHHHWYSSILRSLPPSPHPTKLLYSYQLAINGFSARLSASQANKLRQLPGIVSVIPDQVRHIHTTHTPNFLGLSDGVGIWQNSHYGDGIIIGVLDTGIWPENPSFTDSGLPPVPNSWKGICETGPGFPASACNRKIIGARLFYKGYESSHGPMDETKESKSPRDTEGHGTHTASTAAGSAVSNASLFGFASGEARGMAKNARIAAYKICWKSGCFDSDILAAMDQAISDGVDVISLSVGSKGYASQYDHDSIAIGAFAAVNHGVVVSCSAGNSGPGSFTAGNIAPWILTVGASTIDREFPADVVLGDGRIFGGVSLYSGEPLVDSISKLPLVYAGDCGDRFCHMGRLNSSKVEGKIVVCERGDNARVEKGAAVKLAGGSGMILANTAENGEELLSDAHLIPATMVGETAGSKILEYIKTSHSPNATISFRGTVISSTPPSPKVAAFSSRGPHYLTPEILKPDVIAPGVNILAGWTGSAAPTDLDIDPRRVDYNIISGTSMACPHASGLAALLKKTYPNWSPAAIKSALMTTAYNLDNLGNTIHDLATGEEASPFVYGAGHVDPNRALNPGLVYDIENSDYVSFLCSIGYDSNRIAVFLREPTSSDVCESKFATPGDLNYPSFSVVFHSNDHVVKYKRRVKNVGTSADAVYVVKVNAPPGVEVIVSPSKLEFSTLNQTLSYEIAFASDGPSLSSIASEGFGSIEWSDGVHLVRSPIAVRWLKELQYSI
ncbi:hypothetical protein GQ457_09G005370 [Hibiscus cannabinus]